MLLRSVHREIESLILAFETQQQRRFRREVKKEMNCRTFLGILQWYENLTKLIDTPELVEKNLGVIQKISNAIQSNLMYSRFNFQSCESLDQSALTKIVALIKSYQGM